MRIITLIFIIASQGTTGFVVPAGEFLEKNQSPTRKQGLTIYTATRRNSALLNSSIVLHSSVPFSGSSSSVRSADA